MPVPIGGLVPDFDPKAHVKPRKSLKVMSREIQLGFAAARMAWTDAGLDDFAADPERLGVVCGASMFGSELADLAAAFGQCTSETPTEWGQFDFPRWGQVGMQQIMPLWMLKYLPNMAGCHIGIAHDARGPVNTIVQGDVSALLAIIEAADAVVRGHADLMLAGGTSSLATVLDQLWFMGTWKPAQAEDPAEACRPFDADRTGTVPSEGSGQFVIESRSHAEARGARILGRILGFGRRCEPCAETQKPTGLGVRLAIEAALETAGVAREQIGHVNAHGLGTREDDPYEAQAIRQVLGDVPVTAPKSFMGNSGAGCGAMELALSLIGLEQPGDLIPPHAQLHQARPRLPSQCGHRSTTGQSAQRARPEPQTNRSGGGTSRGGRVNGPINRGSHGTRSVPATFAWLGRCRVACRVFSSTRVCRIAASLCRAPGALWPGRGESTSSAAPA